MTDGQSGQYNQETIRQAASESLRRGEEIRRRIRDLTLEALKARRYDREGMREVVRAVTEGISLGAQGSGAELRHVLAEAFRGMDEALTRSVDAGREALRQLAAASRGIADHELRQAAAGLKKIEEDFVATVSEVAESSNERMRPELRELARTAARTGTETGRQAARAMAELALAGVELAGHFSARFAQIAGGVLAGMADALEKKQDGTKSS